MTTGPWSPETRERPRVWRAGTLRLGARAETEPLDRRRFKSASRPTSAPPDSPTRRVAEDNCVAKASARARHSGMVLVVRFDATRPERRPIAEGGVSAEIEPATVASTADDTRGAPIAAAR